MFESEFSFQQIKKNAELTSLSNIFNKSYIEDIYSSPGEESFNFEVLIFFDYQINIYIYLENTCTSNNCILHFSSFDLRNFMQSISNTILKTFEFSNFRHHRFIMLKINDLVLEGLTILDGTEIHKEGVFFDPYSSIIDISLCEDYLINTYISFNNFNFPKF
ncbi:TPA: hypothetical protein PD805_002661 [Staphylococcus aureus]|nr:hypothetical protein [Staphylococcus aureus]HDE9107239.1 hypothetical protein [Staphylococcus aureus]HDE9286815.1 hypothetical protein [Staphylococcus aureus]HDE9675135.1 hypothetical protein [Staphylococcus aureus]HDF7570467.1 hypothetical protein [Staphylococcus aureus]